MGDPTKIIPTTSRRQVDEDEGRSSTRRPEQHSTSKAPRRSKSKKIDLVTRGTVDFQEFALFFAADHGLEQLCSQARPVYGSSGNAHGYDYAQSFPDIVDQFRTVCAEEKYTLI